MQTCLMEEIIRSSLYTTSSTSGTACDNLRNLAFDSHSKCYVEHGFCSIIRDPRNLYGLFHVLQNDVDDVDGKQAWTQVIPQCLCNSFV